MHTYLRFVAVGLACCSISCASSSTSPDETPVEGPEKIQLMFDWPAGLEGTLKSTGSQSKRGVSTGLQTTYTMTTEPAEKGVVLHYREPRNVVINGIPDAQKALIEPMLRSVPSVIFNGGAVIGIADYEEILQQIGELLDPIAKENPAIKAQVMSVLTEETFLASAQSEWTWRATAFHRMELEVGETVEETVRQPLGVLPGEAETTIRTTLVERLPCPGASERRCVRLQRELVLDKEDLAAAVSDMVGMVQEFEQSTKVEVVAEPETLLTYEMKKVERQRMVTANDTVETMKEVTEVYTWESRE